MSEESLSGSPTSEEVRRARDRVLASSLFRRSAKLRSFLHLAVERALEGRADELKEYTLAVEVYGRRADHDNQIDPIVRTEARRLRAKLDQYYDEEGRDESVRIYLPKGNYAPQFRHREAQREGPESPIPWRRLSLRWMLLGGIGMAAFAGAAVVLGWLSRRATPPVAEAPRILVLPFESFGAPEYVAARASAVSDSVLTRLAQIEGLRIVSRATSHRLEAFGGDPTALAVRAGASHILEGSYGTDANSVLVAARLVRLSDDEHVWSEELRFDDTAFLDLQQAVSDEVAAGVRAVLRLEDVPLPVQRTFHPEAYERYTAGRHAAIRYNNTRLEVYLTTAERRLEQALSLDPSLTPAHLELGRLYLMQTYPPRAERGTLLSRARDCFEKAHALDPEDATTLALLGSTHAELGDVERGFELMKEAVRIAPEDPETYRRLAGLYGDKGFYEEALRLLETASSLDPLYLDPHAARAWYASRLERWEEAFGAVEDALGAAPDTPMGDFLLGTAHYERGNLREARRLWRRQLDGLADATARTPYEVAHGLVETRLGDLAEGRRVLAAYRDSPKREYDHLIELAARLGDYTFVVERVRGHPRYMNYRWLVTQAALRGARDDPALRELTHELYELWLADVARFGPELSTPPPSLPPPDQYLADSGVRR